MLGLSVRVLSRGNITRGTYIIGAVHPELLERGMTSGFLGSENGQRGGECRPHDGFNGELGC